MDESQKPSETGKPVQTEEVKPTVGIEQFEALKAELEMTKKAQAGSDQKVAKLLSELEQTGKVKQTAEDRIAALERENAETKRQAERERFIASGYKMASERGLSTAGIDQFSGTLEELTAFLDARKKEIEAARLEEANRIYHANGKAPGTSGTPATDPSKLPEKERLAYYMAEAEKRMSLGT